MIVDPQFEKISITKEQVNSRAWGYKDYSSYSLEDITNQAKYNWKNRKVPTIILGVLLLLLLALIIVNLTDSSGLFGKNVDNAMSASEVTVVYSNTENSYKLRRSLESFFTYNTYPIKKLIVIAFDKKDQGLNKILTQYPQITPFFIQGNIGQLASLDQVMRLVETQLYFLADQNYEFIRKGFIQRAIQIMQLDHNLSSFVLTTWDMAQAVNCTILDGIYCGFSFIPAMHRKSHYDLLPGDYGMLTGNYSYGTWGGDAQLAIGYNYHLLGKHTYNSPETFLSRIGFAQAGKMGYRNQLLFKQYSSLNSTQKGQYKVAYSWNQMYKLHAERLKAVIQQYQNGLDARPRPDYKVRGRSVTQFGFDKQIQISSDFDYLNITNSQYFRNFQYDYTKRYFLKEEIKIQNPIKSKNKIESQLMNQFLSVLCVTIMGSLEEFSDNKFEGLLKSFTKQAYTNVHIPIFAPKKVIPRVQDLVKNVQLTDYVDVVSIYQYNNSYSNSGILYLSKQYCPKNSVIINLRPTDRLLNSITLKYIKKVYQNPTLMFATFRAKVKNNTDNQNLDESTIGEFRTRNDQDLHKYVKTYRHRMSYPNIISDLTEFYYNQTSQKFFPRFYEGYVDDFHTYAMIQIVGPSGVKFFDDFAVQRQQITFKQQCSVQKYEVIKAKARLKTPIKPIKEIYYPVKRTEGYKLPSKLIQKYKQAYDSYKTCIKR